MKFDYSKFRGSKFFLYLLCGVIAVWITSNELLHFDEGYGRLNLALSSEASISVALLIMAQERQDALQRQQLRYIQHLLEATVELIEGND